MASLHRKGAWTAPLTIFLLLIVAAIVVVVDGSVSTETNELQATTSNERLPAEARDDHNSSHGHDNSDSDSGDDEDDDDDDDDDAKNPHLRPHVPVINNSPVPIEIVWVVAPGGGDDDDKTLTPQPEGIPPGGIFYLYTFVGEQFDVYEIPTTVVVGDEDATRCRDSPSSYYHVRDNEGEEDDDNNQEDDNYDYEHCWQTSFVISEGHEVEVVIDSDFEATVTDEIVLAEDYAQVALTECDDSSEEDPQSLLVLCLEHHTQQSLEYWNAEWRYHHQAWKRMEASLEPYIIADSFTGMEDQKT